MFSADSPSCPDLLTYQGLADAGLSRHHLERLVKAGEYERFAPGVFLRQGIADDTTAAWMAISARKVDATLCLLSAASIHDLTDEIPRASDIAIQRGTHPVKITYPPITWHRFSADTFGVGRNKYRLPGNASIGLYSTTRTVIDLFRLRHIYGNDLAIAALKRWLRQGRNQPSTLLTMARQFPGAHPPIQATLEVVL